MHDPELIFLDEPTAALDPQARRDAVAVLRELKGGGRTIVYTTHHLDEAEALCDRVAIMVDGQVAAARHPGRLIGRCRRATRLLVPGRPRCRWTGPRPARRRPRPPPEATWSSGDPGAGPGAGRLDEHRPACDGVQTRTATLEDVYLELTGAEQS